MAIGQWLSLSHASMQFLHFGSFSFMTIWDTRCVDPLHRQSPLSNSKACESSSPLAALQQ
eukprot:c11542_g1_i1 orf=22-201(-)